MTTLVAIIDTVATAWSPAVPQEAVLQPLRSQRDLDLTPDLPRITCPVTVLHGELDRVRTVAQAAEMVAALPDCRLVTVRTGHTPVREAPAATAAEVRALAARVRSSPPDLRRDH